MSNSNKFVGSTNVNYFTPMKKFSTFIKYEPKEEYSTKLWEN